MKNNSYINLKRITDSVYSGTTDKWAGRILDLLRKNNIKLRQKDGLLHSVNISIPKFKNNCILIGLRYIKKDKSFTEDHFLFEINEPIVSFYKGRIASVLPEYKGAHKEQLV